MNLEKLKRRFNRESVNLFKKSRSKYIREYIKNVSEYIETLEYLLSQYEEDNFSLYYNFHRQQYIRRHAAGIDCVMSHVEGKHTVNGFFTDLNAPIGILSQEFIDFFVDNVHRLKRKVTWDELCEMQARFEIRKLKEKYNL